MLAAHVQLLAASSFPLTKSSGWKSWRLLPVRISSMGYISPVSLIIPIPVAIFSTGSTHRRVKIDENRAGDVFAAAGLSEEGLVRATLADLVDSLLVNSTVGLQAVLEQVPRMIHNAYEYGNGVDGGRSKKR